MKESNNDNDNTTNNASITMNPLTETITKLPIRITSKVIKGFGRGSKELGIPTANLCPKNTKIYPTTTYDDLPSGIYWGYARILSNDINIPATLRTALSIGYNPQYNNKMKTVEPHLIAPSEKHPSRRISKCDETLFENDFYGAEIRISIIGFIRSQSSFNGLEELIQAIKGDIRMVEEMEEVAGEKLWVDSDEILS